MRGAPDADEISLRAVRIGVPREVAVIEQRDDATAFDQDRAFVVQIRGARGERTSAAIINNYSEEELTRLFRQLGEEPAARRIATAIVKQRKTAPLRETLPLARLIEKVVGRHGRRHPATQVFQALRMEVNDELAALQEGLPVLTARLQPGARIAVISFHSLEDRIVKNFFRHRSREYVDRPEWSEARPNEERDLQVITRKPIEPSEIEQRVNPRARSAKLRVAEKLG